LAVICSTETCDTSEPLVMVQFEYMEHYRGL